VSQRFQNRWGVGGGARYVSSQFIAPDNMATVDAYLVLNAAVYYSLKSWDLSLNFKNLADTEYEVRGFGSQSVIPADPFSVFATAEYRF
jgi:iron complex outermembrane receptor protein